jgi:hypothetical protein
MLKPSADLELKRMLEGGIQMECQNQFNHLVLLLLGYVLVDLHVLIQST